MYIKSYKYNIYKNFWQYNLYKFLKNWWYNAYIYIKKFVNIYPKNMIYILQWYIMSNIIMILNYSKHFWYIAKNRQKKYLLHFKRSFL